MAFLHTEYIPFAWDRFADNHVQYHCVAHFEGPASYENPTSEVVTMDLIPLNLKLTVQVHVQPKIDSNGIIYHCIKSNSICTISTENLVCEQTSSKMAGVYFGGIVQILDELSSLSLGGKIFTIFPVL